MTNDFHFFQNTDCRYFPCHGKDRGTGSVPVEDFNCLFCYCPLYFIDCEGSYTMMDNKFKDCSKCTRNHDKDAWRYIIGRINEHMKINKKFNRIDMIGLNGNDGDHYEPS